MALRPPHDFLPPPHRPASPSERELRELWDRHQAHRRERERVAEWRRVLERVRRDPDGDLHPGTGTGAVPAYLNDRQALGPHALGALRPVPREGRVIATGVDTFSPCWYAELGSPLARAMEALATQQTRLAWLLPQRLTGFRVGWFPEHGLVFAEGRPGGEQLIAAPQIPAALVRLRNAMNDLGIPICTAPSAGLRRLDVATDLWMDSAVEGLALLECVSAASLGVGKIVAYRSDRCVESVLVKTRAGRTRARLYDKGTETGRAPRGRWVRLEAQWRFPRDARPVLEQLDSTALRERFARRFTGLWQAAGGTRVGGLEAIAERLAAAVASGQLPPSRARSLAGYLLLSAAGIPQGARRTTYELERDCRELGISASLLEAAERRLDVATILEECLAPEVW